VNQLGGDQLYRGFQDFSGFHWFTQDTFSELYFSIDFFFFRCLKV